MITLDNILLPTLQERKSNHLWRHTLLREGPQTITQQINGKPYLCFLSNDYLGLANHPQLIQSLQQAASYYGVGSGASHAINGHTTAHHQLETAIAKLTHRKAALLFSTGFMANLAVITALSNRQDLLLHDRLNHASLLDGTLLSGATLARYRHNDIAHCEQLLIKHQNARRKFIITDGVFSMDGDIAPLPELAAIAATHNAWLIIDDAHGFGVLGEGGGVIEHFGLSDDQAPVVIGTLSKAFGCFGAFVAGSEALIETCQQLARSYIYTTALPPAFAAAALTALEISQQEAWRRQHLQNLIHYFQAGIKKLGLNVLPSPTPIQPIIVGDNQTAIIWGEALKARGILVGVIRSPTVPTGQARLRISLSAAHNEQHVDQLIEVIAAVRYKSK